MALIKCHECGSSVSSEAKVCPYCGIVIKKTAFRLAVLVTLILIALVSVWFFVTPSQEKESKNLAPDWKLIFANDQTGFKTFIDTNSIQTIDGGAKARAVTLTTSDKPIDTAQIFQDPNLNGLIYKSILEEKYFACDQKSVALKSVRFTKGEMGTGEVILNKQFDASKTIVPISDQPESLVAYGQSCEIYFENNKAIEKKASLSNKTLKWDSTAILEGVIQASTFSNCCFNGTERLTEYKSIKLTHKVNFEHDSRDETAGEILNVDLIALLGEHNQKFVEGAPIKIICSRFIPGINGHYALPVNCVNPKVVD